MNKSDYSEEEAREILKRAVDHQEVDEFKYNKQQLFDLGRDLGLAPEAIVKAEQEVLRNKVGSEPAAPKPEISAEEAAFRRERLQPFKIHLAVFLAAIPLLFFLNLITSGLAFPWFLIAVPGWAMGLVGYYMTEGRMEGDAYDDAYKKWQRKRQPRQKEAIPSIQEVGMTTPKKLYRSRTDKMVEGVCGGLGTYFGMDPTWIRLVFGLSAVGGFGLGVLLYFVMMVVVPLEPETPEVYGDLETPAQEAFDFERAEREVQPLADSD